jgi:hypothetical protein
MSEFVNIGLLYLVRGKEFDNLDFVNLLYKAQKTETFKKIDYLPGLSRDYDYFIHDDASFYIALVFFLFDGNINAQKFIISISMDIIRKLKLLDEFVFEHHASWVLLMSVSHEDFFEYFDEVSSLVNARNGIIDTIVFCPTYTNNHRIFSDSKLILVPNRIEYTKFIKEKFEDLKEVDGIIDIAVKSLSNDWKDELDIHFDLGLALVSFALKSLIN